MLGGAEWKQIAQGNTLNVILYFMYVVSYITGIPIYHFVTSVPQ